jgi:ABC-type amino acid transport substrate-binding protein
MKNVFLVLLAVLIALGIQNFILPKTASNAAKTETAYERVMRTNTLRCAYGIYPPFLAKDPNTGKLSGIGPDIMEAIGKASGLTIVWGPEVDWGDIATALQNGKADAFCTGMFLTPKRGRVIAGSIPIFFSTMEAYARPNDLRFDNNLDRINQKDVRLSVNLGDISEELAQQLFPNAQRVYKSAMGGEAELFLNVANGKADVTLSGPTNMSTYNQNNPSSALRKISLPHPVASFQGVFGMDIHETALQQAINASLQSLIDNGVVDGILRTNLGVDYNVAYFPPKPQSE